MEIDPALRADKQFIFEKLGYSPSKEQWAVHLAPQRERLVAGGERGGKSKLGAADVFGMLFWLGAKLIWLYGADYDECSQEFDYCKEHAHALGLFRSASKMHNPGRIELSTGTLFKTVSGQEETKIGREAPDIILVCEAAKITHASYLKLKARLSERRGYLLLTGTFESSLGWYPERWKEGQIPSENFQSFSVPTWANLAIFPGGRNDPEILKLERELPEDVFQERLGGIPCPPQGLVFKEFSVRHHVREVEYEPSQPVYLWIDPGYAGAYAVEVVQLHGDKVYIVDEIYEQGLVTSEIIQIARLRPWWPQVHSGVIDIAARQHQAMPAVAEIWQQETGLTLAANKIGIIEGIERYRTFLKVNPITSEPSIFINPKCKGIISEHGGAANPFSGLAQTYRYKIDREGLVVGEEPEDKNNHGIKAVIYGLVDRFGYASVTAERLKPRVRIY